MNTTRRRVLQAGGATASLATLGIRVPRAFAQAGAQSGVVRFVPHADLRSLDPIWTTANISAYHGAMIYDTLFGIDADLKPQPQMVESWEVSDDQLIYRFKLRPGLKWHDGTPVTAEDCVASLYRWAARDGGGQHMMKRVEEIASTGDDTLEIRLSEPYGLVLDVLAKTSTPLCYMMRKDDAATDPNEQVTNTVGSGPFRFVADEWVPGSKVVYERNPDYVPRDEPPSGMSGGKVVNVERVEWHIMPDAQTALAALQAGEIDFFETPPLDLIDILKGDPAIRTEVLNELGNVGLLRMNHLHPPFDNVDARRAMLALVDQEDYMRAVVGNPDYYRICGSLFTCGSPMENDTATDWMQGAPDVEKAKELFQKAGYDGRPVVVLQPTDVPVLSNAALVTAQLLRSADINVEVAASDWGGVVTRRAVKEPVEQGGWNIFHTWAGGNATSNPIALAAHAATGEDAWFGWPTDEKHEELRNAWAAAPTLEERQKVAEQLQANGYDFVIHCVFGQWTAPVAYRDTLSDVLPVPEVVPFWNLKKSA
jgi:peptide/nickel transport system substrate-binding protein